MDQQAQNRIAKATGSNPLSACSTGSLTLTEFSQSIKRLAVLKRTTAFSDDESGLAQALAWYAALADFPLRVVNRAIVELSLTESRFPELSDLYRICRKAVPKTYSASSPPERGDEFRPTDDEITTIGQRLGLEV